MREVVKIRNRINKLSGDYDQLSQDYEQIARNAANLRDAYELEKAQAMLTASGTIPEKEAQVVIRCSESAEQCHAAEATQEYYKQRLKALAAVLNAAQTEAALIRDEMKL